MKHQCPARLFDMERSRAGRCAMLKDQLLWCLPARICFELTPSITNAGRKGREAQESFLGF
jgi:hypothetical protein